MVNEKEDDFVVALIGGQLDEVCIGFFRTVGNVQQDRLLHPQKQHQMFYEPFIYRFPPERDRSFGTPTNPAFLLQP